MVRISIGSFGASSLIWRIKFDAAAAGHRQVQQQQVEAALAHVGQHFEAVDGFPHHFDFIHAFQDALQSLAHDGVVVGDHDADHDGMAPGIWQRLDRNRGMDFHARGLYW